MSSAEFQTFLTGGVGLLVVAAMTIAWLLWREGEYRQSAQRAALAGVGQELKISLQRVLAELMQLAQGGFGRGSFLPSGRPQLDAVNNALVETNRQAIAVMGAFYEELEIRKMELRGALLEGEDYEELRALTLDSCIEGIATLFLWEVYDGASPQDAPTTRSWDVRAWMKAHGFGAFEFEELHLRDEVVERLRSYGMHLTPRPLTHTAHEYWSMRYDRKADPRAPFGKRRFKKIFPPIQAREEIDDDVIVEDSVTIVPQPVDDVVIDAEIASESPRIVSEPGLAEDDIEARLAADSDTAQAAAEPDTTIVRSSGS